MTGFASFRDFENNNTINPDGSFSQDFIFEKLLKFFTTDARLSMTSILFRHYKTLSSTFNHPISKSYREQKNSVDAEKLDHNYSPHDTCAVCTRAAAGAVLLN